MKDLGILKGIVQEYDTNDKKGRHSFFSLRKMVRDFLKKFNVSTYDPCCPNLNDGFLPFNVPNGAEQLLVDEGAVSLLGFSTLIETADPGTNAFTLGSGTKVGQVKKIKMVVDNGDATIDVNNGAMLVVFDAVGDFVLLQWDGANWFVLENNFATITLP